MSRRPKPIPYKLPNAPMEYDISFFNQLNRQIEKILNSLYYPETVQCDGINIDINTLPSAGSGLRPGTVFRDGTTLKIVRENDAYATGFTLTVGLGTVTVTTT